MSFFVKNIKNVEFFIIIITIINIDMFTNHEHITHANRSMFNHHDCNIDEFGMTSDRSLTIYTYKVKVEGDTIYLLEIMPNTLLFKPSEYICYVYKKSEKIPEEWKKYKPDW